jgi:NADH-quinone oxidoreductase subunit N
MTLELITLSLPTVTLVAWMLVLLLVDLWIPKNHKWVTAALAALGLAAALGVTAWQAGQPAAVDANHMIARDSFSTYMNFIFLGSGLLGVALAFGYLRRSQVQNSEYYILLLASISGMMLMAQAYNLVVIFLALELLTIPLYVLTAFGRPVAASEEASLKYFYLGSFAGGFVLYGSVLMFGATRVLDLPGIFQAVSSGQANLMLLLLGAALLLVGFGFKVAAVPFHMWTPDVYQGAPSPLTAFMSVAVKAAGFTALLRVLLLALPQLSVDLTPILWGLAALTMVVGNVLAIAQKDIKRMLAYSSIAHAGYLLLGLTAYGQKALSMDVLHSVLFYLLAYGLTSFGAWAVVMLVEQAEGKGLQLENYAGLGRKYPWLGVSMLVFMLSFAGVPLTLGFWGKFYLFRVAVDGGFWALVLVGLLASLVSAYYYLRVVVYMFMRPGEAALERDFWLQLVVVVMAILVVGLSFVPGFLLELASKTVFFIQ